MNFCSLFNFSSFSCRVWAAIHTQKTKIKTDLQCERSILATEQNPHLGSLTFFKFFVIIICKREVNSYLSCQFNTTLNFYVSYNKEKQKGCRVQIILFHHLKHHQNINTSQIFTFIIIFKTLIDTIITFFKSWP